MTISEWQTLTTGRNYMSPGAWACLLCKATFVGATTLAFAWLLANRLAGMSLDEMRSHFLSLASGQWLAAVLATVASFWAVGHYDGVIHSYLSTGARPADARKAGAAAIAISQTLGLGVITGALVRWRMLPDLTLGQAAKITTLVALSFLSGWVVIAAVALILLPLAPFKPVAFVVLAGFLGLISARAILPRFQQGNWPNLFIIARLIGLTALDTLTCAFALWAVCPPDLAMPLSLFLPAFLLALGAGLISGAPGGIGAFEVTFFALLPQIPEPPLLAAILAWRTIYFATPAVLAVGVAVYGPRRSHRPIPSLPSNGLIANAGRAEVGLLAQGHLGLISGDHDHGWLVGRTAHCLVGLFDPLSGAPQTGDVICDYKMAITCLIDCARSENRLPVLYKCTARTAVAARRLGQVLCPVAREAWIDPRKFALDTPTRAGLRRKLRRATKAGVVIASGPQNNSQLAQIAEDWAARHGGERGFSMGRFDQTYLSKQRLYVALLNKKPIAFASFHIGKYEWTLDLMRHTSSPPDGTMQALIAAAIADAAATQLPRFSLSAVPYAALRAAPPSWIGRASHRLSGGRQTGLAQFKSSFAPNWQTLYLAAPHRSGLVLAAAEIAREVHYPVSLRPAPHDLYAQFGFATAQRPWQRGMQTTTNPPQGDLCQPTS